MDGKGSRMTTASVMKEGRQREEDSISDEGKTVRGGQHQG